MVLMMIQETGYGEAIIDPQHQLPQQGTFSKIHLTRLPGRFRKKVIEPVQHRRQCQAANGTQPKQTYSHKSEIQRGKWDYTASISWGHGCGNRQRGGGYNPGGCYSECHNRGWFGIVHLLCMTDVAGLQNRFKTMIRHLMKLIDTLFWTQMATDA